MNAHLVKKRYETPLVDELMNNLQNKYRLNKNLLQSFLPASYEDERQGQTARPKHVQPPDASLVKLICQVLLDKSTFADDALICRRMTALSSPSGTGKKKTMLALIVATHCLLNDVTRSTIRFELLRRQFTESRTTKDKAVLSRL